MNPAQQLALVAVLQQIEGAVCIADVKSGAAHLPKGPATVIALRGGEGTSAYVEDSTEIRPERLLDSDWIVPGRLPPELLK